MLLYRAGITNSTCGPGTRLVRTSCIQAVMSSILNERGSFAESLTLPVSTGQYFHPYAPGDDFSFLSQTVLVAPSCPQIARSSVRTLSTPFSFLSQIPLVASSLKKLCTAVSTKVVHKSVKAYATMPIVIMGRKSLALIY